MKKILISLSAIAVVATVAVAATQSFFSDQETSTGNNFTAGSLDLRFQADGVTGGFADVDGKPLFGPAAMPFPGDMKPGDTGERTVKLWVDNNPACGQVAIDLKEDQDNSCTGPEAIDDPDYCTSPTNLGELNDAVNFEIWADPDCNNKLGEGESVLTHGTLTGSKLYGIGELPTSVGEAACYGVAYCYGSFNLDGTCNGANVNNASQTDSFKADIIINALQKRNQFDKCLIGENT
jgi:predicted ribosomally synthesized peptide with SipW-like signal peptide